MLSKRRLKSLKKLLSGYIFKSGWMAKTKLTHFEKDNKFKLWSQISMSLGDLSLLVELTSNYPGMLLQSFKVENTSFWRKAILR